MNSALWLSTLTLALALACSSSGDGGDDTVGGKGGTAGSSSAGKGNGGSSTAGKSPTTSGSAGKDDGGGGSAGSTPEDGPRGACKADTRLGGFDATLEDEYTTVSGKVLSKFVRASILTEVASDATCTLIKAENPRCSPSCGSGKVCSSDQECVDVALSRNVGTVEVSGLAAPVSMMPVMPGNIYAAKGEDVPHPGFEAGAKTVLTAAGGDLPGFTLRGVGVAQLELPETAWQLERGQPFNVTWTAGEIADARVRITLRVDQHGNSPVTMTCISNDDGELEVAANLVDALLDAGVTGFPSGDIYREAIDSVELEAGCVEFRMGAHEKRALKVAGYVPCTKQADCPEGQTCNKTLERCE